MIGRVRKNNTGIWIGGVVVVGALFGWIAWADEITQDVSNNAQAVASNPPKLPVDPNVINLIQQGRQTVESTQNSMIVENLYGSPPNDMQPIDVMGYTHLQNYCNGSNEGTNCPSDPLLMNGDIKLSTILSGTVYDSSRQAAVQAFLNNLIDPATASGVQNFLQNSPVSAAMSDMAFRKQYAQAIADEALLSVARQPFAEMIAKRTPPSNDQPSEMQLMEQQAMMRFMNSAWSANLSTLTPQQIQEQQVMMQAFQIWMQYQQYRQMERVEALLATTVLQAFQQKKSTSAAFASINSSSSTGAPAASTGD